MASYVALLYSVVLPGGRLRMADLRALAGTLGFREPRTLLSTGNLVFQARKTAIATLEGRLEKAFAGRFGKHVDIIVRDAESFARLAAVDAFPDAETGATIAVRVMRRPIAEDAAAALEAGEWSGDRVRVVAGDPWLYFPAGRQSDNPRLLAACSNKAFGAGTFRNATTIRRVADVLAG